MHLSLITEAESVEGLFDVLIGLWSTGADTENLAERDILLQLSLAEDHSAFCSLRPRACQQDVGSMTPTLQQCSWDKNTNTVTHKFWHLCFLSRPSNSHSVVK